MADPLADHIPLAVEGVGVRRGPFHVRSLTVELAPSQCAALVGSNGSGKSTLLLGVIGLLPVVSGSVSINGRAVGHRQPPTGLGAMLSWPGWYPWVSGVENLRLASEGDPTALARVDHLLEDVGLTQAARRRIGEYSTGMLKRLEMARTLLFEPALLVLDEPTNGLDEEAWHWLVDALVQRMSSGLAVLIATHDVALVEALGAERIEILDGTVTEAGPTR